MPPLSRKASFAAVVDARTRVLILGSLPGDASLAAARYYAHPRNQFWALTGAVIGVDLVALAYPDRLAALLRRGIGLWDSIASAERRGSLDTAIRDIAANPLAELAASLPALACVACNGAKSAAIAQRALEGQASAVLRLPSSSPAHAAMRFDAKLDAWLKLRKYLG